ncbi:ATP-dependent DNA helicase 2 subunit KU80-like [Euphorbia lathyris]|uniref:ATP-dependent DNA helicase 2 subunit KU80-like n=1 Tax=Euphorbia lathyris TaxID=212925 RepID=UPI0033132746
MIVSIATSILQFKGDLANVAAFHIKENDHVHIIGQPSANSSPIDVIRSQSIPERFYHCLALKSKQPDAPLDRTLKKITEPDPQLLRENNGVIDTFLKNFAVKENPRLKKSTRRFLPKKPSG